MVNEDQHKILQAINEGKSSESEIVSHTDLPIELVRYYLGELDKGEYVRVARAWSFDGERGYSDSRLTDKGKVAATQLDKVLPSSNSVVNNLTITGSSVTAPIGIFQNSGGNTFNANQSIDTKIAETISIVDSFYKAVEPIPEVEREFSKVHLDNLKAEIKAPDRRDPKKIRAYFAAFVSVIAPFMMLVANSTDFLNNLTDFGERIGVEIPQIPKQP